MTSPYWTVMNDLDSTITSYLTVRDLIRDNTEDPKVLQMAVDLFEYFIDRQDQVFKKAWQEVVVGTTATAEEFLREREYYEPSMPPWGHSDMESLKYSDKELDAMCDHAAYQESKEQIYKNYRAAIDEYNKLNEKYEELKNLHEELQDLFYRVDSELDETKVKYQNCQKNYHAVVNNVMNSKSDKIDLDLYP